MSEEGRLEKMGEKRCCSSGCADGGGKIHFAQAEDWTEAIVMTTEVKEHSSWLGFQREPEDVSLTEDMK